MEGSSAGYFRGKVQPILLVVAFAFTGSHAIPEAGF